MCSQDTLGTWSLELGTGSTGSTGSPASICRSTRATSLLRQLDHWDVPATCVVNLNVCVRAKVLTNGVYAKVLLLRKPKMWKVFLWYYICEKSK